MNINELIGNWFDTLNEQDLEIKYTHSFFMNPSLLTFTYTNKENTPEIFENVFVVNLKNFIGVTNFKKYTNSNAQLLLEKTDNGYTLFIQEPPLMQNQIITIFLKK